MSECDGPQRRNGDRSRLSALANSAVFTILSRGALVIVMGLVAFISERGVATLDSMAKDVQTLSRNIAVVSNQIEDHSRRIEKVENKVFR